MAKFAVLLTICLVVLFTAAISATTPSITMEFVGEFHLGRPAIVRVTTTDMDLSNTIYIQPKLQDGDDAGKTNWGSYITSGANVVSNMFILNPDILEQNNFLSIDGSTIICVDEATHRPLIQLNFDLDFMLSFTTVNMPIHSATFPDGKFGSYTFLCPVSVVTNQASAPEFIDLVATQSQQSPLYLTLTPPAVWSWRTPVLNIDSASYSANSGNLLGGRVKFQFTTDTSGIHHAIIYNGPQPIFYNRRNQNFTSYQCGNTVGAYIISGVDGVEIHVEDSAANGAPIACTFDVDGYTSSASTDRSQITIGMDTVLVAQDIVFPQFDATFQVISSNFNAGQVNFAIEASDLNFSNSPLYIDSIVEIRFSGIDIGTLQPTSTEYRQDEICTLYGTFSHNDKSVFIKDVSEIGDSFTCTFNFLGTTILSLNESAPAPTIQVLVDGVPLYNRAVRSTSFPLYLPVNSQINNPQKQIYQDDSTIKHVVEFSLQDNQSTSYSIVPRKPILVLSYKFAATWPTPNYPNVLSCETTSSSLSKYTPLVMTFDLQRRTWTADLSTLIDTDVYKINFRCTRSEAVVKKFDIVQNTANVLLISFLDVVFENGYNYNTQTSINERAPLSYLEKPTNPSVPQEFTQYFSFSSSVFITDFSTMTTLADNVSTKVFAAIKAGYNAYDVESPTTPANLNPKLVNKSAIIVSNNNISSTNYSPTFGETIFNLFYTIIAHQFQRHGLESITSYLPVFSSTAHEQRSVPIIYITQYFTSGTTYDEIRLLSDAAASFATTQMSSTFYKDAFSTLPAIPFNFDRTGFQFPTVSQNNKDIMNPITACGYYQVGYSATAVGSPSDAPISYNYKFIYDEMASSNDNRINIRFTCRFAEACVADADCDSGYCSEGLCAAIKPQLKYPYVKYDTVADFSEYNDYNYSVITSLSVVVIAVIVAMLM